MLPFGDGSSVVEQQSGAGEAVRAEIEALRAEVAQLQDQSTTASEDAGSAELAALSDRIDELAGAVEQLRNAPPPASTEGAAGDEQFTALSEQVASLESSLSDLAASVDPSGLESLRATVAELGSTIAEQQQATAEADEARSEVVSRLDSIEERLSALDETVEGQPRMARAIAATALKAAVDRGDPFVAELDTYAAVAPEPGQLEKLRAVAANGVPTPGEIEASMGTAAPAMIDAAQPVDPDAGVVDRLVSSARSLVSVRPIGAVEGDDVPAIVARMEAAIQAGDYETALAEYESLPATAQAAGADLAEDVRTRMEADAALAAVMSDAVRPAGDASGDAPANGG
ncbi:MAG: hypothetical protein K5872_15495 [Rhizobiaceae bacterium]|nr:hypothetical protein [Rhizobiaceae bacterium]MCV0407627.1 hypothetical protein [Rhizobiaceae bacterium]